MSNKNIIQKNDLSSDDIENRIALKIAKYVLEEFTGAESDYAMPLKKTHDYGSPESIERQFKKRKSN